MKLKNLSAGLLAFCSFFPNTAYPQEKENQQISEINNLVEAGPTSHSIFGKKGSENYSIDYDYDSDKVRIKIFRKSGSFFNYASYTISLMDYPANKNPKFGTVDYLEFLFSDKRSQEKIGEDSAKRNIKITTEYDSRLKPFSSELKKDSEEVYMAILEYVNSKKTKINQEELEKIDKLYQKHFQRGDEVMFKNFYSKKSSSLEKVAEGAYKTSISSGKLSRSVNTPKKSGFIDLFSLLQFLP